MKPTAHHRNPQRSTVQTVAAMIAGLFNGLSTDLVIKPPRQHLKGYNKYRPHQGAQEKARRVQQMAKGMLVMSGARHA